MFTSFRPLSKVAHVMPKGMEALAPVFERFARRLGFHAVVDENAYPYGLVEHADLFAIAARLRKAGVLKDLYRVRRTLGDEPPVFEWSAIYSAGGRDETAGGSSFTYEQNALAAALAECLERSLWRLETDYFDGLTTASFRDLGAGAVDPRSFAGLTDAQRFARKGLPLTDKSVMAWARAESLTDGALCYIPAQSISASGYSLVRQPLIRQTITTGLATAPTKLQALLRGILEIFERDALMITWLNRLTTPRVDLQALAKQHPALAATLAKAKRYRYRIDVIRLVSDVPAHTVCAVIWNDEPVGSKVSLGLGTGQSLAESVEHAISEGLRITAGIRVISLREKKDPNALKASDVRHREHAIYWGYTERYRELAFLTAGEVEKDASRPWDSDDEDAYFARIIQWAREKGYGIYAADLGRSKKNTTPWHVYSMVMPQFQWMHLDERYPNHTGARLLEVPKSLGYTPRKEPFTEPHPFV